MTEHTKATTEYERLMRESCRVVQQALLAALKARVPEEEFLRRLEVEMNTAAEQAAAEYVACRRADA